MTSNDIIAVGIAVAVIFISLIIWAVHDSHEMNQEPETKPSEPSAPPPQELPPDVLRESAFTGLQILGGVIATAGMFGIIIGLSMDISVRGDVVNLGLMNDRIVTMIGGGFGLLTGTLLMVLSGKKADN